MNNPLLEARDLPAFSLIRPEHAEPAVAALLAESRALVEALVARPGARTWEGFVEPLERMEERLNRAWAPVRHLNSVMNNEALRTAYNACLPKLSEHGTEMGQHEGLYRAFREIADAEGFAALAPGQRKAVTDALRDFHLSGVDLPPEEKDRFKAIALELSALTSRFEENLLDATHAWKKHIADETALSGLPESALELARQTAEHEGLEGFLLTLEYPSYSAVMTHADNRDLREEVYRAYVTRASDLGSNPAWDNSETLSRILALRHEEAGLLGYPDYATLSLSTKMAETPAATSAFLRDLSRRARPFAERELAELRAFAQEQLRLDTLEAWDIAWVSERLRRHAYGLSQEDMRPYFPVERVLEGLFGLVGRLFGVQFKRVPEADVWHPDVRLYDVLGENGGLRARCYLDLYARPKKRGGAWMDECANRMRDGERVHIPVAFLTCNASPPAGGKPSRFTHDEVITLFHEFGHGLHHMLTRIDWPAVSGINGVEWDAVELPSQFMENWCWEREPLDRLAAHWETGAPLPDDLFERMQKARHFQTGMFMLRQVEFALFDLRMHHEFDPARPRIREILDEVRDEVAVLHPPPFNRFEHGFSHIFAGGYAAGYYSYLWAEVLSADAFARFEEEGLFNPETGHAFLHEILEIGGSRKAKESFLAFRGREPHIDALLRHSGMAESA